MFVEKCLLKILNQIANLWDARLQRQVLKLLIYSV